MARSPLNVRVTMNIYCHACKDILAPSRDDGRSYADSSQS